MNTCGKTRPLDNPYEVWVLPGWEWRVLRKYQSPEKEQANRYARWFVACRSPFTRGGWQYGDSYVRDITDTAQKVEATS